MRKMANELIITEEQTENPIPSDKPAHIQWHPGYVSAIKMEFKDDKNDYCFGSAWKVEFAVGNRYGHFKLQNFMNLNFTKKYLTKGNVCSYNRVCL